jgi:aminoglycoside phosphotransferase (APT) family kinase protein
VHFACADPEILGGAFLIMERRPGWPLLAARRLGISRLLVETQLRLHALDPDVLLEALEREVRGSSALVMLDGHLEQLQARVDRHTLDGLRPAMSWLRDHCPPPGGVRAICHGDFHPQNLLCDGRDITAVLDWPNVLVTDPAYDVAATRMILALAPLGILPMNPPRRWLLETLRRFLLALYLRGYRRRGSVDASVFAYYEAVACMRGLVRVSEARLTGAGGVVREPDHALDASSFGDRLGARFARLTGIRPVLPGRGAPRDRS